MSDPLDQAIREALQRGDDALPDDDPSLSELIRSTFQGRWRRYTVLLWCSTLAFTVLLVGAFLRLLEAETTRLQILWGLGVCYCLIVIVGMKIWYWMHLSRLATAREIKRVELQIAYLAQRLDVADGASTTPKD